MNINNHMSIAIALLINTSSKQVLLNIKFVTFMPQNCTVFAFVLAILHKYKSLSIMTNIKILNIVSRWSHYKEFYTLELQCRSSQVIYIYK